MRPEHLEDVGVLLRTFEVLYPIIGDEGWKAEHDSPQGHFLVFLAMAEVARESKAEDWPPVELFIELVARQACEKVLSNQRCYTRGIARFQKWMATVEPPWPGRFSFEGRQLPKVGRPQVLHPMMSIICTTCGLEYSTREPALPCPGCKDKESRSKAKSAAVEAAQRVADAATRRDVDG